MKNMSYISHPVVSARAGGEFHGDLVLDSGESGFVGFEWAIETLAAQFVIVIRDLERFAAMKDDPRHIAWIDETTAALATIELYLDPVDGIDTGDLSRHASEIADVLLEESDWLLDQSELVSEEFGDERLAVRLRGLSAACYEAVRCLPVEVIAGTVSPDLLPFGGGDHGPVSGDADHPRAA